MSLLRSVGSAVQCLKGNEAQDGDKSTVNSDQVFVDSMNDFIRTLRSVNTSMKRQIWGLEEAGIVTLRKQENEPQPNTGANKEPASLEPDGDGKIGGMDVGWLNSRSNKVESDMESELWDQAEHYLRRLIEKNGGGGDPMAS